MGVIATRVVGEALGMIPTRVVGDGLGMATLKSVLLVGVHAPSRLVKSRTKTPSLSLFSITIGDSVNE